MPLNVHTPRRTNPRTFPEQVSVTATAFEAISESAGALARAVGTMGSKAKTPAVLSHERLPINIAASPMPAVYHRGNHASDIPESLVNLLSPLQHLDESCNLSSASLSLLYGLYPPNKRVAIGFIERLEKRFSARVRIQRGLKIGRDDSPARRIICRVPSSGLLSLFYRGQSGSLHFTARHQGLSFLPVDLRP